MLEWEKVWKSINSYVPFEMNMFVNWFLVLLRHPSSSEPSRQFVLPSQRNDARIEVVLSAQLNFR
jgi:hypothetical protein